MARDERRRKPGQVACRDDHGRISGGPSRAAPPDAAIPLNRAG
jgi:hypothetical protein